MTELEILENQKFVLECKDHWTSEDWAWAAELDRRILELNPPKPQPKKVWYEVVQTFKNSTYEYTWKTFGTKEAAQAWIDEQPKCGTYYIQEA